MGSDVALFFYVVLLLTWELPNISAVFDGNKMYILGALFFEDVIPRYLLQVLEVQNLKRREFRVFQRSQSYRALF